MRIRTISCLVIGLNSVVILILLYSRIEDSTVAQYDKEMHPVPYYLSDPWVEYISSLTLEKSLHNILNEEDYCERVSEYRKKNPGELDSKGYPLFQFKYAYSDYPTENLVKELLISTGIIVLPEHRIGMANSTEFAGLPVEISLFHTKTPDWHRYHKIGTHFLCEGQRYNQIPGHLHIVHKDEIIKHALKYEKSYYRRPECFKVWEFMPQTFDISDPEQCKDIFTRLLEEQSENIEWIVKEPRDKHNGEGVHILTPEAKEEFLETHNFGQNCENMGETKILVQKYIQDPLLVNKKKIDIRAFLLVASMDPVILLYHDGYIKFSVSEYEKNTTDISSHLTVAGYAREKYTNLEQIRKTIKESKWNFYSFEQYLIDNQIVQENWLEEYFRPLVKQKMAHLFRMASHKLLKHPGVFELFGLDLMLDQDLQLWFLEANFSPGMNAINFEKEAVLKLLNGALLDLQYALNFGGNIDRVIQNSAFEVIYDGRKEEGLRDFVLHPSCQ